MLGELVLAVFERAARLEHDHPAHEHPGLIDHAFAHQQFGNFLDAEAARNIDDLVVLERAGRREPLLADVQYAAEGDRENHQRREDCIADHHQRMAHALGAQPRSRHPFRLERGARAAWRLFAGRRRRRTGSLPEGIFATAIGRRRTGRHGGGRSNRRPGSAAVGPHLTALVGAIRWWIGIHAPVSAVATCKPTSAHSISIGQRTLGGIMAKPRIGLVNSFFAHDLARKPVSIPDQVEDMLFGIMRCSGGRSARHSCRRSRTSSTARCRYRVCAHGAAPDRSAFRPKDYRD